MREDPNAKFSKPSVPTEEDAWSWITFSQANHRYGITRGVLDEMVRAAKVRWFAPHEGLFADEAVVRLGGSVRTSGKEAADLKVGRRTFRFVEMYYSELDLRLIDERARRRQGVEGAWRHD